MKNDTLLSNWRYLAPYIDFGNARRYDYISVKKNHPGDACNGFMI